MSSIHCIVLGIVLATAVAGATFFPTLSFSADSGTGPGSGGPREACRTDMQKFCSGMKPGPELGKCMDSHLAELSAACKTAHEERKQKMGSMGSPRGGPMEACGEDIRKLCKDIQPGEGRILKCLKDNETSLSDACKAAGNSFPAPRGGQQPR